MKLLGAIMTKKARQPTRQVFYHDPINISNKMKILFVDDRQDRYDDFKEGCDLGKHKVYWAQSAQEAIEIIQSHKKPFDLVCLDYNMASFGVSSGGWHYQNGGWEFVEEVNPQRKKESEANNGLVLVNWIVENKPLSISKSTTRIIVHSNSPLANIDMTYTLVDNNYNCYSIPSCWDCFDGSTGRFNV